MHTIIFPAAAFVCSLSFRELGYVKKTLLYLLKRKIESVVEILVKSTCGPWLFYTCLHTHSPGPVLANPCSPAFLLFWLYQASQARRDLEGLPVPQLQMLPKSPQSSAFSSEGTCPWNCKVTEPEKSPERASEVRRKKSVVTPCSILLTDNLFSFNFTFPYLPLQPLCSRLC